LDFKGPVIDMNEPESNSAGKARAAALHAEIDKLAGAKPAADGSRTSGSKVDGIKADEPAAKPTNPRDYIQQWMAEHDKKPEK
jgi:hypothetical protein